MGRWRKKVGTRTNADQFDLFAVSVAQAPASCAPRTHSPANKVEASLLATVQYAAGSGGERGRPPKRLRPTPKSSEPAGPCALFRQAVQHEATPANDRLVREYFLARCCSVHRSLSGGRAK